MSSLTVTQISQSCLKHRQIVKRLRGMPYVDRRLPEGLQLPMLREPLRDKRIANLKHEGRVKGATEQDLQGSQGRRAHRSDQCRARRPRHRRSIGFLEDLAAHHKKMFTSLLVRCCRSTSTPTSALPRPVSAISTSLAVPSDHYFIPKAGDGAGVSGVFEHIPPSEPIAPIEREFGPQTERERQLLVELEALTSEQLLERARASGFRRC